MQTTFRRRKRTSSDGAANEEKDDPPSCRVVTEVSSVQFPRSIYYISSLILFCLVTLFVGMLELRKLAINGQSMLQNSPWIVRDPQKYLCDNRPVVWVRGKNLDSGYLSHVFAVFEHLGYRRGAQTDAWTVLWSHEYPFVDMAWELTQLKSHQRVNHFPGSGYITNKVSLSTGSRSKYIPTAFKLPQQKEAFIAHSNANPDKLWVQKSNHHRGIRVKRLNEISLDQNGTFIQEFIANPLLIDDRKFDIGVYTVMTSLNPLRVYTYSGDVLLRFCSKPYSNPVDPEQLDSYIIGDNYTPVWQMPSLRHFYINGSLPARASLDAFLRKSGRNPKKMWEQIEEAISSVYYEKEREMIKSGSKFKMDEGHFFELVRFDFVVDEHLDVFLMEANMSPNLSSAHFPQNGVLYEQVLFNTLSLIGLGSRTATRSGHDDQEVSDRNIAVFADECSTESCEKCDSNLRCRLCSSCMTHREKQILKDAFLEHHNRRDMARIIPVKNKSLVHLSRANEMMWLWFKGKCELDARWCS